MTIEHENAVFCAVRDFGTPVALLISECAKELARRHVVMLLINPHPDEFLKVHCIRAFGMLAAPFSHIKNRAMPPG